ncbi:DNA primase [Membranicola marinus]|uniref:DNA primase n=1 Tax=Membranihabitans marinus TaxID=1227546 RepID=A0A953LBT6_9BACT|nr:DNA primase [Membranihabitans marinus]MBY5957014.1 DNA primase [Membranihabitans marinus]
MISQKTIGEIFDRMEVRDVIQDFVGLKKRGVNYIGLCPFHNEKTPSFTVSPSKNIYKCFGCGRGGNGIDFLMEHEAYSYPEALRYVARLYNIPIEETYRSPEVVQESQRKDALQIVNDFAQEHYKHNLWNTDAGKSIALGYLKERGFIEKTIKAFDLGYAHRDRKELTNQALQKSYKKEYLQELGLTTRNDQDFFSNRIIFPIHSLSGKPIAFAGRILHTQSKAPKYLNSPESEIYHKRKVLFGLDLARKSIRDENKCYLVEGYTDVMMMHQNGVENVVATSGTALTSDQIRLIKRYTDTIHLIFDSDAAGTKATLKAIDLILAEAMNVKILPLPEGQDPDGFIMAKGHSGFQKYAEDQLLDFLSFKIQFHDKDQGEDPVSQSELIRNILSSIALIDDGITRHLYIRETAQVMGLPEQTLVDELTIHLEKRSTEEKRDRLREVRRTRREEGISGGQIHSPGKGSQKDPEENTLYERDIIRALIQHGHKSLEDDLTVADFVIENIEDVIEHFQNEDYKNILNHYLEAYHNEKTIDFEYFNRSEDAALRKAAIDAHTEKYDGEYSQNWIDMWDMDLQTQPTPDKNYQKDVQQALMRFKLRKAMDLCVSNRQKIQELQKAGKMDEVLKRLVVQQKLLQMRDAIAKEFKTIVVKGSAHGA